MRRAAFIALLILVAALASPALAHGSDMAADFNNDGFADLAVGVPGENGAAGAVNILYGTPGGLSGAGSQVFFQIGGAPEVNDRFGSALAAADFNNDNFADLAVGAPGEAIGSAQAAGAVSVLYGSPGGLTATGGQLFTQVGGAVEARDRFGFAMAAGDFDNNGFADLAVGAPDETAGGAEGAGVVSVLYGSSGGLTASGGRLFTQVGGTVEAGDGFGWSLAAGDFNNNGVADLAAGALGETVGSLGQAGAVSVLYGSSQGLTASGGRLFTQVGGTVEINDHFGFALAAGDFNGNGVADLAVGAPEETVGSIDYAGAVSVLYGSTSGLTTAGGRLFTQVGGTVEAFDWFGWSLAAGDFNHNGIADLAVGAPLEAVGEIGYAGAVSVLYGSTAGLTTAGGRLFTQVGDTPEGFDEFGAQLAAGDFGSNGFADLAAAAPNEPVGTAGNAGAVSVLPGSASGLTTSGGELFTQNSPGVPGAAENQDHFGGIDISFG